LFLFLPDHVNLAIILKNRLSLNDGFVTAGTDEVREENVILAFRDYKPMAVLFSQVWNTGSSPITIDEVGGSGRLGVTAPTIAFDYDRLGTSIFFAFGCQESKSLLSDVFAWWICYLMLTSFIISPEQEPERLEYSKARCEQKAVRFYCFSEGRRSNGLCKKRELRVLTHSMKSRFLRFLPETFFSRNGIAEPQRNQIRRHK
jgi:hypothetical protein